MCAPTCTHRTHSAPNPAHNPILCIVPPHMLDRIAVNGSRAQRIAALQTLGIDHTLRTIRAVTMASPTVRPLGAMSPGPSGRKRRTIYDTGGSQGLPGAQVRGEGAPPTGDVAVDEAYDGLGATYDLYCDVFSRDSIDDQGMPLTATVHFGQEYNNAFWNGGQMVFGDGDGDLFNRFTASLDVIGHELAHGVTQFTANLEYRNQSGALNESLSDVFGSLVKQRLLGQTAAQADWLVGAELLAPKVRGVALRSMKAPGTAYDDPLLGRDPQPAHMRDFVSTVADNGGVHINSGIPNHAFYLAATRLGGRAWDLAGRIWYATLLDPRLASTAGFGDFARLTVAHTPDQSTRDVIRGSWADVGIVVA